MGLTVKNPRGLSVAKTKQKEIFITSLNGNRVSLSQTPNYYVDYCIGTVILSAGGSVEILGGRFEKAMFETAKTHTRQCWARDLDRALAVELFLHGETWVWCLVEPKCA